MARLARQFGICFFALIGVALSWPTTAAAADLHAKFSGEIEPLLVQYCYDCHSGDTAEGGFDIAGMAGEPLRTTDRPAWRKVSRQALAHTMPPETADQPSPEERQKLAEWIARSLRNHPENEPLDPGPAQLRRLSRAEYYNTLRDLLHIDFEPEDPLPADGGGGGGFTNNASTLFLAPVLLEKFLATADQALGVALENEAAKKKLIPVWPDDNRSPPDAARATLEPFLRRAYRRPVEAAQLDRVVQLFGEAAERGESYENALRFAMKGALVSPRFLFIVEQPPAPGERRRRDHHELAVRLSYFLWSSMPDDELFRLADEGKLHDDEVVSAQIKRMLADDRAAALATEFGGEWIGYVDTGVLYRPWGGFDGKLAHTLREEVRLFLDHVLRHDRPITEIIDADYTFANKRLAEIYGISGVEGDEFRKVELNDRRRGGVITMASTLVNTSYPGRSSPVLRGRWVLAELLGSAPPPPPTNVGNLPVSEKDFAGLTLRQRFEQHRNRQDCRSCHAPMDPIGFALENFDHWGKWREKQNDLPIDATGVFPSGESFDGPAELKETLLERRDQFAENTAEKMLTYALGRGLTADDFPTLYRVLDELRAADYRSGALIESVVRSAPFQDVRGPRPEETGEGS